MSIFNTGPYGEIDIFHDDDAAKLRSLLARNGFVLKRFLRAVGIDDSGFFKWLNGEMSPSERSRMKLKICLEVLEKKGFK